MQEVDVAAKEVNPETLHPMCLESRKASERIACKDLEGHIFTIGSGNKGNDGEMLCASKEKMETFIRTNYSDDAAQEWTSKKHIVLTEPTYSSAIETRHAERV